MTKRNVLPCAAVAMLACGILPREAQSDAEVFTDAVSVEAELSSALKNDATAPSVKQRIRVLEMCGEAFHFYTYRLRPVYFFPRPQETIFPADFELTGGVQKVEKGSYLEARPDIRCDTKKGEVTLFPIWHARLANEPEEKIIVQRDRFVYRPESDQWFLDVDFVRPDGSIIEANLLGLTGFEGCKRGQSRCEALRFRYEIPLDGSAAGIPTDPFCRAIFKQVGNVDVPANEVVTRCFVSFDQFNPIAEKTIVDGRRPGDAKPYPVPLIQLFQDLRFVADFESGQKTEFQPEKPYLQFTTDSTVF
jgi:hypothetical protein